jgi:uncharacterized membrane-anchored protein YhcB (DUF1043 family)
MGWEKDVTPLAFLIGVVLGFVVSIQYKEIGELRIRIQKLETDLQKAKYEYDCLKGSR